MLNEKNIGIGSDVESDKTIKMKNERDINGVKGDIKKGGNISIERFYEDILKEVFYQMIWKS